MFGAEWSARFRNLVLLLLITGGLVAAPVETVAGDEVYGSEANPAIGASAPAETVSFHSSHGFKVFLDVGHGGYDPGGTGPDGLPESFVNLEVAKQVAQILRRDGIAVELDRNANRFVSLSERVALADESGAGLFVGLYCNASSDRSVHGTTTYYYHPDSYEFARFLEDRVASHLGLSNDGVVRDNLYVIKYTTTRMPDVLIEYAYISNLHEEHLLSQPAFRGRIADAVAGAIAGYFAQKKVTEPVSSLARVTSIDTTNGTVQIHSLGRPAIGSFTLHQDQSNYFVVTLTGAVLSSPARSLSVGPPFSGEVNIVQYTRNPDVVHVAVREDYPNSYQITVEASVGGQFTTTIYPVAN